MRAGGCQPGPEANRRECVEDRGGRAYGCRMSTADKTPAEIELEDSLRSIREVGESADGNTSLDPGEEHDEHAPSAD